MELILKNGDVDLTENKERARQIMEFCESVAPQFYKNRKLEEIAKELQSIELMIQDIPNNVLEIMCKLAVRQYSREQDGTLVFNLTYILKQRGIAEFMVKNQVNDFDDFYDNIDDVLKELEKN